MLLLHNLILLDNNWDSCVILAVRVTQKAWLT